jgi:deoxyribose-phosphate aldolase
MTPKDAARRALACLDLTNLEAACTEADIEALCARARTRHGDVAAVCIWPRFVGLAGRLLAKTPVRIATVVDFPSGDADASAVLAETEAVLKDGAQEIDLVVPYRELMEGRPERIRTRVKRVKGLAGQAPVKAILETGVLQDEALIREACALALDGGADFLKTSTGKVAINATQRATRFLLEAARGAGRPVGVKPAGGVRTAGDATGYVALADEVMGDGWASPVSFRIGASGVLAALLALLDDDDAPVAAEGY